jgi:hypothetical protein
MSSWLPAQLARIADAVDRCYKNAELVYQPDSSRVVPLAKLLAAWPIMFAELPQLTRRSAATYLSQRSGHKVDLEADADLPLAGFLYSYPYFGEVWGCILVEKNDRVERRRFSAAHEIGHYLLHFLPRIKKQLACGEYLYLDESLLSTAETGLALPHDSKMFARPADAPAVRLADDTALLEREANHFAAELLMPEPACRKLVQKNPAGATPYRLASEFMVSPAAMEYRMRSLGLLALHPDVRPG